MAQKTYRIEIYDKNLATQLTTVVFPIIRNLTLRLNDITTALFEVPKASPQAIDTYLKEMNKIKILRWSEDEQDHVPIWVGSIEAIREGESTWQVGCVHLLDVLKNRYTSSSELLSGVAPDEIYDLLDTINAASDTGIDEGTTDITESINLTFNRKSVFDVLSTVVEDKLGYEFEIDPETLALNLLTTIGQDISATTIFIRNDNNPNATNLSDAKMQSEGKEIFNYIIGQGKTGGGAALTQTVSDATSIAQYGRREKIVSFDEARDNTRLLEMATAYLEAHKDPLVDLDIIPEPKRTVTMVNGSEVDKGYDFWDDYSVGDLVSVKYITSFKEVERTERVVEVRISVDEASSEAIQVKTTNEDQSIIAEIAARTAQEESERRLQNLENKTYT